MAKKLRVESSTKEIFLIMSEGNPSALMILREMMKTPKGLMDIYLLDHKDIRGSRIHMLYSDCCDCNHDKFDRTLLMIRSGVFTQEEINHNLGGRSFGLSFIDDSIEIDGVPPYGENFSLSHPKWDEWCEAQKESFRRRIVM